MSTGRPLVTGRGRGRRRHWIRALEDRASRSCWTRCVFPVTSENDPTSGHQTPLSVDQPTTEGGRKTTVQAAVRSSRPTVKGLPRPRASPRGTALSDAVGKRREAGAVGTLARVMGPYFCGTIIEPMMTARPGPMITIAGLWGAVTQAVRHDAPRRAPGRPPPGRRTVAFKCVWKQLNARPDGIGADGGRPARCVDPQWPPACLRPTTTCSQRENAKSAGDGADTGCDGSVFNCGRRRLPTNSGLHCPSRLAFRMPTRH